MTGWAVRPGLHARLAGSRSTIVVVGDVMLDRYVDGASTRLSPEAPVPVVDVAGEHVALGGAANVAAGLAALGAGVTLVGVVRIPCDSMSGALLDDPVVTHRASGWQAGKWTAFL